MKLPIPKGLERRLRPHIERAERFIREWEWTWTRAFVGGVVLAFIAITTLAVIPSWWLGFADSTLEWRTRLELTIRDAIMAGWTTVWIGIFIVTAYQVQKIRKRLRGERQAERYSGGYR